MEVQHAKDHYLFSIYPLVFSAGTAAVERWSAKRFWLKVTVAAVVFLGAQPTVPLSTWVLPPDQYLHKWGRGEENTPIYLCRGINFDIQKIWWHSHHWN